MEEILYHNRVGIIHLWVIHTKPGTIIHQILGGKTVIVLLVMVEVVLVLGPPNSTPQNTILVESVSIGGFRQTPYGVIEE